MPGRQIPAALSGLTTRGRCFVAAGLACAVSAIALGERDLLRIAVLLLALPLVAAAVVARTRYRLTCSRQLDPTRVPAGQVSTITLRLDNVSRLPTSTLLLEDALPYELGGRPRFVLDRVEPGGRRDVTYAARPRARGRYRVGPLSVRLTDPFGFCELTRSFLTVDDMVVTPLVTALPAVPVGGDRGGGGESQSRAIASHGDNDVATRAYQQGDDLRRVHWRSTARIGELMVRREEQPWQSRAVVLLDTRASAHRGDGPAGSFEWAVATAASIGVHLAGRGFTTRLLTDTGAGTTPRQGALAQALLLDELATVTLSRVSTLATAGARLREGGGLLVAVLGRIADDDAAVIARVGSYGRPGIAVLLDTGAWTRAGQPDVTERAGLAGARARAERDHLRRSRDLLSVAGWRVVLATPGISPADVWAELAVTPAAGQRGGLGRARPFVTSGTLRADADSGFDGGAEARSAPGWS